MLFCRIIKCSTMPRSIQARGRSEKVSCDWCSKVVRKSNMSRHLSSHDDSDVVCSTGRPRSSSRGRRMSMSAAPDRRSRSSSRESHISRAVTERSMARGRRRTSVDSNFSITSDATVRQDDREMSLAASLYAASAATNLTDQHGIYDEQQLCDYIARHFPQVPKAARKYLVIGATSGAQHAAHMHFIWDRNKASNDAGKRLFATEADSALSFWAMGLRPGSAYQSAGQRPHDVPEFQSTRQTAVNNSRRISSQPTSVDATNLETADATIQDLFSSAVAELGLNEIANFQATFGESDGMAMDDHESSPNWSQIVPTTSATLIESLTDFSMNIGGEMQRTSHTTDVLGTVRPKNTLPSVVGCVDTERIATRPAPASQKWRRKYKSTSSSMVGGSSIAPADNAVDVGAIARESNDHPTTAKGLTSTSDVCVRPIELTAADDTELAELAPTSVAVRNMSVIVSEEERLNAEEHLLLPLVKGNIRTSEEINVTPDMLDKHSAGHVRDDNDQECHVNSELTRALILAPVSPSPVHRPISGLLLEPANEVQQSNTESSIEGELIIELTSPSDFDSLPVELSLRPDIRSSETLHGFDSASKATLRSVVSKVAKESHVVDRFEKRNDKSLLTAAVSEVTGKPPAADHCQQVAKKSLNVSASTAHSSKLPVEERLIRLATQTHETLSKREPLSKQQLEKKKKSHRSRSRSPRLSQGKANTHGTSANPEPHSTRVNLSLKKSDKHRRSDEHREIPQRKLPRKSVVLEGEALEKYREFCREKGLPCPTL